MASSTTRRARALALVTLGTAGAFGLTACGGGAPAADDGKGPITFTSFGGAYQEAQKVSMLAPYTALTGVQVVQDQPTDYPKLTSMVRSGNVSWDVVDADPFFALANCGKLVERLDTKIVDTSKMPQALVSPCAVPSMTYSYVLVYNTKLYGDHPPQGWADFFDTKRFPGKRALQNAAQGGGFEAALIADGVAPGKLYPLDYERAFRKLDSIKNDLVFWETGAQSQEMMEKNEVGMLLAWNGRAYNAAKNGAPFRPQWNQNFTVYDVFVVPKGAKHKDAAMRFIAYATGAEAQSHLAERIPYGPIHADAHPKVDALSQTFLPTGPAAAGRGIVQDQAWWAANTTEATTRWSDWVTK